MFGGSFDPVHIGHMAVVRGAIAYGGAESAVLMVPAARSPHKVRGPNISDEHRLAMLMLAVRNVEEGEVGVWRDEILRGGPSYTVHTLERLKSLIPETVILRLLLGEDQLRALHTWHNPREIVSLAPPLMYRRGGDHTADLQEALRATQFWTQEQVDVLAASVVTAPLVHVSSTPLRGLLGADETKALASEHLPPGVYDYIQRNSLYAIPGT